MKRAAISLGLVGLLSVPVFADVTIMATGSGKGLGMGVDMQTTTYIKGSKMRTEVTMKDKVLVTIMDLDAQKMISIDVKKKEAEVYDLTKISADIDKNVGTVQPTVTFAPNGQTKDIAGRSCAGYDLRITLPIAAGGKGGPGDMSIVMGGPMWIAKGAPGSKDFAGFYKVAVEKGFIFNSVQQAKAQPAQARAFNEMYRSMIATGGMSYGQEITIKFDGGPMAGMMSKMGGTSMSSTVTKVTTDSVSDDLFVVPADFKSKVK